MFVCMFVCTFFCLYVCLSVCWICAPDRASFDTRVVHGKKRNSSAEVPIEKLTHVPPTLLPLRAKTYATHISFYNCFLISFYNFFLQIFSYLTSLLIKSLTRYILLYICNNYKRLIESLTTCILLYICNKYKKTYRIPTDIYLIIYL